MEKTDILIRSLAMQKLERLPHPGSVIVSSFTSPIDCLYLAAVFDPVFTASYPHTKLVERISLLRAVLRAFMPPTLTPSNSANLVQLSDLIARYSNTCIVVFPECTTTNGRAILTLSSKAVSVPSDIHIFPINIRYTPARVLTPVPYAYTSFLWKLLSNPKHCIRVRLAASMSSPNVCHSEEKERTMQPPTKGNTNRSQLKLSGINIKEIAGHSTSKAEAEKFSTELADTLARLGRVPRVALSVKDKEEFYRLWSRENK